LLAIVRERSLSVWPCVLMQTTAFLVGVARELASP
jgi:hypothetical protein